MEEEKQEIGCYPSREKYWSELTSEEKVERMREQVKRLYAHIEEFQEATSRVSAQFFIHEHHDGKLLMPVDRQQSVIGMPLLRALPGTPVDPNEAYF